MSMIPSVPDGFKPKSFWERSEGTTGMITLGLFGLGGFFLLKSFLPSIINVLDMTVEALGKGIAIGALCTLAFILFTIVTNSKVHVLCEYFFKSIMRWITGKFVPIDPIGIMKNYIDDMKKWCSELDMSIKRLTGQIEIIKNTIYSNNQKVDQAMNLVKIAKEKGNISVLQVNARQVGRLESVNKDQFGPLLSTMEANLRVLKKYREASGTVIEDMTNDVSVKSMQRSTMLSSYSAMKSAMKVISGDKDKKELFDQAMEYTINDYQMKMGEIQDFVDISKTFIDGLDMQNGVYEANALDKLKEWESKADSIILGTDKQLLLENQPSNNYNFGNMKISQPEMSYSKFV